MSGVMVEPPGADDRSGPSGPATWKVVAGTVAAVLAVAAVAGGGWWWTNRDDDGDEVAVVTAATAAPSTEPSGSLVLGDDGSSLLFTRTTADGIELRATLSLWGGEGGLVVMPASTMVVDVGVAAGTVPATTTQPTEVGGSSAPTTAPADPADANGNGMADVCEPIGDLTAWAISDRDIGQAGTAWTAGRVGGLWPGLLFGGPDSRLFGAVVQVDADITLVRLIGPDGRTDEMAPVNGAVVVAVEAPGPMMDATGMWEDSMLNSVAVIAEKADGSSVRVGRRELESGHPAWSMMGVCQQPGMGDEVFVEELPPPTTAPMALPPAGDPPADPEAAEQAIRDALATLMDTTRPVEERVAVVDDPVGLAEAFDRVDEMFGTLSTESAVQIDELVFVSPDQAVFTFDRTMGDGTLLATIQGRARLVDGVWKITRSTYCKDIPVEFCGG